MSDESSHQQYLNQSAHIAEQHRRSLLELGAKVRAEVILPVCRKHKIRFMSGNGTFFFTKGPGRYDDPTYSSSNIDDAPRSRTEAKLMDALEPILELLDHEVGHNDCLGYYVEDVGWVDL